MLNRLFLHLIVGMIFKQAFRIPMRTVWQQWGCTSGWDHRLTREIITPVQVRPRTTTQPGGRENWRGWAQKNCWHFQHQTIIAGAWITKLIGYKANKAGQHCWSIHIPSTAIILDVQIACGLTILGLIITYIHVTLSYKYWWFRAVRSDIILMILYGKRVFLPCFMNPENEKTRSTSTIRQRQIKRTFIYM